jgi:hypothetical protein
LFAGDVMNAQVEPTHYGHPYNTKERFISYWHQISEIIYLKPSNALEIGIGNGFVSNYLINNLKLKMLKVDIDRRLKPDIAASIIALPFSNESF